MRAERAASRTASRTLDERLRPVVDGALASKAVEFHEVPVSRARVARDMEQAVLDARVEAKRQARRHDEALLLLLLGKAPELPPVEAAPLDTMRARHAGLVLAGVAGAAALAWLANVRAQQTNADASPADVARVARSPIAKPVQNRADLTIATEWTDAGTLSKAELVQAIPHIEVEWRWNAVLDLDVCPECAALDGKRGTWAAIASIGLPPRHPRCRCFLDLVAARELSVAA